MRGLNQFIADIRNCPNKETESKRVQKEMAKIREKFVGNRALEGYQKKKYLWKLLYMVILGYDVDFGHAEAATLITTAKFSEKYTGYIALSLMATERDAEIFMKVAQSIRNDLLSNNEVNQSLALSTIGTLAPKELIDVMSKDIEKIALSDTVRMPIFIRKKAVLCLLRIFRKYREQYPNTEGWSKAIYTMLDQKNLGFLSSTVSLMSGVATLAPNPGFEESVPKLIAILQKLILQRDCPPDYQYYKTPNPWVVVKILKALQLFPPPHSGNFLSMISDVLLKVITKTEVTRNINKNNTEHGILFECINLIVHYRNALHSDLKNQALSLLGVFVSVREPNIRYLALEAISKFSDTAHAENLIQEHLKTILKLLRDNDISIRRRALDILYIMCSPSTAPRIVEELINYSDEPDLSIKEELVLKIAILAEKFADDLIWYIDVVVRLITNSGDYITDDIWYRIIQIITGFVGKEPSQDLQRYAANKLFTALSLPNVHENVVKVGAYVLAEYGSFIANQPGKEPYKIFETLSRHWVSVSANTRGMLLNAYVKLAVNFPELKDEITSVLEINSEHWDPDIQQRAVEYSQLLKEGGPIDPAYTAYVLAKMPAYSEDIQNNNPLLKRIYALKAGAKTTDPTVLNELKKVAEEELYKSRSYMTQGSVARDLNTIGRESVNLGEKSGSPSKSNPSTSVTTDLLGGDDDLLGTSTSSSESSQNIQSHPFYQYCKDKIAVGENIIPIPSKLTLPSSNGQEWKSLVITENGVVYQDNNVSVNYKSSFQGSMGKIAMQIVSKGASLSNVVVTIPNTNNIFFNSSPVQYEGSPSLVINCINTGVGSETPTVNLNFNQGDSHRNVNFGLPLLVNKWISPVDMPQQAFEKYYNEYTTAPNPNYFRLDNFIKNPAPSNVPVSEVLKRFAGLLSKGLNLKVSSFPNENEVQIVSGVGQYVMKSEGSQNPTNLPLMIQAEGFEQNKEYLRISLRGAANKDVLKNLYQLITLIMLPA